VRGKNEPNGLFRCSLVVRPIAIVQDDKFKEVLKQANHSYRYVVAAQVFKAMKSGKAPDREKAKDIEEMAKKYPGLYIAYAEEEDGKHYSVLERWSDEEEKMVAEYRVELPGKILVGEGKPNNQNHAIIFTRGEAVQAIDMNQDNGLENALKCKQLMNEFGFGQPGAPNIGRIVGYREHVFTHNVSSPAEFFSLQELTFVTASQRLVQKVIVAEFLNLCGWCRCVI
jgi:callose synthase